MVLFDPYIIIITRLTVNVNQLTKYFLGVIIGKNPVNQQMSNLAPIQSEEFKEYQFKGYTEELTEPLAKKVTGVKLPQSIHDALHALPQEERVKYLRRVICEAVKRDLIDAQNRQQQFPKP